MKKLIALALASVLLFTLCSCGKKDSKKSDWPNEERAMECIEGAFTAESEEELASYLDEESQDYVDQAFGAFPEGDPTVEVEYQTRLKGYDIYYVSVSYDGELYMKGASLLKRDGGKYRMCVVNAVRQSILEDYLCSKCGGEGKITTGLGEEKECSKCEGYRFVF